MDYVDGVLTFYVAKNPWGLPVKISRALLFFALSIRSLGVAFFAPIMDIAQSIWIVARITMDFIADNYGVVDVR